MINLSISIGLFPSHRHTVVVIVRPLWSASCGSVTCHLVWRFKSHLYGSAVTGRMTKHVCSSSPGNCKVYQAGSQIYDIILPVVQMRSQYRYLWHLLGVQVSANITRNQWVSQCVWQCVKNMFAKGKYFILFATSKVSKRDTADESAQDLQMCLFRLARIICYFILQCLRSAQSSFHGCQVWAFWKIIQTTLFGK